MRKKIVAIIIISVVAVAGSSIVWFIMSEGYFKKEPVKAKQVFQNTGAFKIYGFYGNNLWGNAHNKSEIFSKYYNGKEDGLFGGKSY